jgi:hypothetical protein
MLEFLIIFQILNTLGQIHKSGISNSDSSTAGLGTSPFIVQQLFIYYGVFLIFQYSIAFWNSDVHNDVRQILSKLNWS